MNSRIVLIAAAMCLCTSLISQADKKHDNCYNYKRGVEAYDADDNENALKYLQAEVADHKDNGDAWAKIAAIYGNANEWGTALTNINNAIKYTSVKDKDNAAYNYYVRAVIYDNLEDSVRSVADFTQAIQVAEDKARYYQYRGVFYQGHKDYSKAFADFQQEGVLDPGNADAYLRMGVAQELSENYDDALTNYNYALKLEPNNYTAITYVGDIYRAKKKYAAALDQYITVVNDATSDDAKADAVRGIMITGDSAFAVTEAKLKVQMIKKPNEALWPYIMASVYDSNEKTAKAAEYYVKSYTLNTNFGAARAAALCYVKMEEYNKAVEYCNYALQLDPEDAPAQYLKAATFSSAGELDSALVAINKYIEMSPETPDGYMTRADIYFDMKKFDKTEEDYTMAINLDAEDPVYYIYRGRTYLELGRKDDANNDFKTAISLDTLKSTSLSPYPYLYLGDYDRCIAINDSLIAVDPTSPNGYYNAACLYSLMKKSDKSIENMKKAFELGYHGFGHLNLDSDLDNVRNLKAFKSLVSEYQAKYEQGQQADDAQYETVTSDIPYVKKDGVTEVKCTVNGLPLRFIFDTGAADVTMSNVEAAFMLKNEYLSKKDIVGTSYYGDANGDISEGTVIVLKEVKFGDITLNNVRASVVHNQRAPLLLGQSVFQKLGKIEIDNSKQVIRITHKKKKENK